MQNIVGFVLDVFFITQTVLKEIALPRNGATLRQPSFPEPNGLGKDFLGRKTNQKMNVIRHEQGEMAEPMLPLIIETNVIENGLANWIFIKMILLSWFRADGYEIIGVGCDPVRSFMIEAFTVIHVLKMPLR